MPKVVFTAELHGLISNMSPAPDDYVLQEGEHELPGVSQNPEITPLATWEDPQIVDYPDQWAAQQGLQAAGIQPTLKELIDVLVAKNVIQLSDFSEGIQAAYQEMQALITKRKDPKGKNLDYTVVMKEDER